MPSQGRMIEWAKPVVAAVPIDTTGAAVSGDWISLKHHRRALVVIMQGAWAGGTPAVTLAQATSASGGSEKALAISHYWQGTALTDDIYSRTTVSSDTFNLPATANTVTFLEVHSSDLDEDGGFGFFQVEVASPGSNADLIAVLVILYDGWYNGAPDKQPTSIA